MLIYKCQLCEKKMEVTRIVKHVDWIHCDLPMMQVVGTCPRCQGDLTKRSALSRRDNKTCICNDCGTAEALEERYHSAYRGARYWKLDQE
jgi:predicted RNA-binding Zn-ribbon protein involved in translation (DUF1610 family)